MREIGGLAHGWVKHLLGVQSYMLHPGMYWTFGHPIVRIRTMMDVLIRKSYNASRELEMLWELGQDM